jgi:hypothetical protein
VNPQTPDWRQAPSYGSTDAWDDERWRWEFARRSDEIRLIFAERVDDTARRQRALDDLAGLPYRNIAPVEDPDMEVSLHDDEATRKLAGFRTIPNPNFPPGKVPIRADECCYPHWIVDGVGMEKYLDCTEPGERIGAVGWDKVGVVFDLASSLDRQLEQVAEVLKGRQKAFELNKQRRAHKAKWLLYLRILDAKALGVSHTEIARVLSGEDANGWDERGVRDVLEAASRVRDNFPN